MTIKDLDRLYEIYEDSKVKPYVEALYERKEEEEFTKAYIENMYGFYGYGLWLVCLKEDGKVIGRMGLSHRELNGHTELELGYLLEGRYQNQGYAKEACQEIVKYAFDELEAENINIFTDADNTASRKLAEKLGFIQMGYMENEGKLSCYYTKNR